MVYRHRLSLSLQGDYALGIGRGYLKLELARMSLVFGGTGFVAQGSASLRFRGL